jgi:hypothetical protein
VSDKLATCFIVPNATRWNSYFHAIDKVRQILDKHSEDKIVEVFQLLEVPIFRSNEIMFVKEYCSVMQPLACALDILQAETKCFIGYLLPTLTSLRTKLLGIKPTLKLAIPLVEAVLAGLNKRFKDYDIRHNLILASVTLPQFRLRWLEDDDKKSQARNLLYEQLRIVQQQELDLQLVSNHNQESGRADSDDDFFSFGDNTRQNIDATAEVDMYLSDTSREIECLSKYPAILKLFKKVNTPLPSSAPVERLFSLGGQILTPRRNRLTDAHFQRQLLLRSNKSFLCSQL